MHYKYRTVHFSGYCLYVRRYQHCAPPSRNDPVTEGGVSARSCHPCFIRQCVKPPLTPLQLHFSACNPAIIPTSLRCKCYRLFFASQLLLTEFFLSSLTSHLLLLILNSPHQTKCPYFTTLFYLFCFP